MRWDEAGDASVAGARIARAIKAAFVHRKRAQARATGRALQAGTSEPPPASDSAPSKGNQAFERAHVDETKPLDRPTHSARLPNLDLNTRVDEDEDTDSRQLPYSEGNKQHPLTEERLGAQDRTKPRGQNCLDQRHRSESPESVGAYRHSQHSNNSWCDGSTRQQQEESFRAPGRARAKQVLQGKRVPRQASTDPVLAQEQMVDTTGQSGAERFRIFGRRPPRAFAP